ncbi:histidine kinase N-terminal 7TM domain-containing protein [Halorientalis regularis]|uniref:histidine kinase n=1 Tax=Halorientalis regularis TaxID=660518 RepID=A0A1G7GHV2_9EURY|nr:histidine kinase N-terminal 7TM domain-containing protein [Halorientalis regularis]SDE87700.1 PAS domain S-box-containing protein [Halorientalis regularis]
MVGAADVVGVGLASVAIPAFGLIAGASKHRSKPGVRGFVVAVVGIGCWSLASGLRALVGDPGVQFVSVVGQLTAVNVTILGWALLVAEFVRRRRIGLWSKPVAAVLVIPACTVALAVTSPWHHLVYTSGSVVTAAGFRQFGLGPWYPIHVVYVLSLSIGAAVVLFRELPGSSGFHRRQVTLLFLGWLVGTLGAFDFFLKNVWPWPFPPYVDVTPVGFLVGSAVWGLALFRHDLFELVPIGRRTAVETMPDAVLTADVEGRIVDANPAARSLLASDPIRKRVSAVFADYPGLLEHYRDCEERTTDVQILDDGTVRHFSATTTPIVERGQQTGTVIVLRDVSALKRREQELDRHRQVYNRIVRHNLRNELTVIRGNAEEIARRGDGQLTEFADTIRDRSNELIETSEKARRIMRIIEADSHQLTVESRTLVDGIAAEMREQYPSASIETSGPAKAWVSAHEDLEVAVENLVENAVVHNEGAPTVEISIEKTGETVEIAVTDDGPGIPDSEIAVLDRLTETALEHSSGAGLWLVNWIVTKSDGDLDFAVTDRGTTVTVTLQAATVRGDDVTESRELAH